MEYPELNTQFLSTRGEVRKTSLGIKIFVTRYSMISGSATNHDRIKHFSHWEEIARENNCHVIHSNYLYPVDEFQNFTTTDQFIYRKVTHAYLDDGKIKILQELPKELVVISDTVHSAIDRIKYSHPTFVIKRTGRLSHCFKNIDIETPLDFEYKKDEGALHAFIDGSFIKVIQNEDDLFEFFNDACIKIKNQVRLDWLFNKPDKYWSGTYFDQNLNFLKQGTADKFYHFVKENSGGDVEAQEYFAKETRNVLFRRISNLKVACFQMYNSFIVYVLDNEDNENISYYSLSEEEAATNHYLAIFQEEMRKEIELFKSPKVNSKL
jgi:hypothetical protein